MLNVHVCRSMHTNMAWCHMCDHAYMTWGGRAWNCVGLMKGGGAINHGLQMGGGGDFTVLRYFQPTPQPTYTNNLTTHVDLFRLYFCACPATPPPPLSRNIFQFECFKMVVQAILKLLFASEACTISLCSWNFRVKTFFLVFISSFACVRNWQVKETDAFSCAHGHLDMNTPALLLEQHDL